MKKIALWNNYTSFGNNQAFNPDAYGIGEDLGYPFILLKERIEERGFILETLDMDDVENYEYILFIDVPNPNTCCKDLNTIPKEKRILILLECEMIYKSNARNDLLEEFYLVFSYNDNLVNNYGYKKIMMPNKIKYPDLVPFSEKKFSTMIAGNKVVYEEGELYSERLKTIRYMRRKHSDNFDLYGIGWNKKIFRGNKIIRQLNRLGFLQLLFGKNKCYKGKIEKKISILKNYKYCFCYENSKIIPGYISEKIMDCFFSGCVPIYYGAPNINEYIPQGCYIDWRNYANYEELYDYISQITEEQYNSYIYNISKFLKSDEVTKFSAESFVDTIISEVIG